MMDTYIKLPDITQLNTQKSYPTKTYAFDFEKKRIIGYVDGIDALNQSIKKAILTPRFKCLIYDNQYGSEIRETITTNDATEQYIISDLPRLVKGALLTDDRILEIKDFECRFEGDKAYIKFSVDTIYGETDIEEVIGGV